MAERGWIGLAAALSLVAGAAAAQPPGDSEAQRNVRESRQYEQLVCSNAAFRARRIAQECGPLQGSSLYQSCVASFNCQNQPTGSNWRQAPPSETIK